VVEAAAWAAKAGSAAKEVAAVAGAAEAAVPSTSRLAPPLPPILQGCARLQLRGLPFVGPRSVRSRVMDIAALLRVLTQAPCSLRRCSVCNACRSLLACLSQLACVY